MLRKGVGVYFSSFCFIKNAVLKFLIRRLGLALCFDLDAVFYSCAYARPRQNRNIILYFFIGGKKSVARRGRALNVAPDKPVVELKKIRVSGGLTATRGRA